MKSHCLIVPMAVATLLATGCQSSPPATGGVLNSSSPTEDATAFPADRTATLWVPAERSGHCAVLEGLQAPREKSVKKPENALDLARWFKADTTHD